MKKDSAKITVVKDDIGFLIIICLKCSVGNYLKVKLRPLKDTSNVVFLKSKIPHKQLFKSEYTVQAAFESKNSKYDKELYCKDYIFIYSVETKAELAKRLIVKEN